MSLELVYPGVSQEYKLAEPTVEPPQPVPYPIGWHVFMHDGQRPFFVKHDEVYTRTKSLLGRLLEWLEKTFRITVAVLRWLKYTNETFPLVAYDPVGGIEPNGKVIVKLEKYRDWIYEMERTLGKRTLGLFVQPGYGFCDTDAGDTNPYKDDVHLGVIDCGGNRRNGLGQVTKSGNKYEITETQSFWAGPNPERNYDTHPQLMEKQVDVGDVGNGIFWRTADADVIWPFVSDRPVAHKVINIAYYPQLPIVAKLDGYAVEISEYCFQGSKTFVFVTDGLPSGWYLAETMGDGHPVGTPGNDKDLVRHIEHPDWPKGCPPPIAGWRQA